ncbi:beta-1,4-galactosyltransferase 7 isoform X2 [Macrobrachium rosenbergii]|uniref:beta-1,4-galactosyltransferase 7 isoform X2 n=1 Tax=Macrobrachium rosenbergii TaxID=79674 RepID=UPI0034D3DF20
MTLLEYRQDESHVRKCVRHGSSFPKAKSSKLLPSLSNSSKNIPQPSIFSKMTSALSAMLRMRKSAPLLWGLVICLVFFFTVSFPSPATAPCDCNNERSALGDHSYSDHSASGNSGPFPSDKHKMALLIPFRDRFEELMEFAPHIHAFLNSQKKNHHIYVINQVDNLRFNRASLLNVGFLESAVDCDYIAMHDVDLLPMNHALIYEFPHDGPFHVAAPHLHPRYHYPTFIGGVLLVKREDFRLVDGLSNKYWGWGLEDDEFFARLKEANLPVHRPGNLTTGNKDTFKHIHDRRVRRRDMIKCYNQQEVTRRRDRETGLSTTRYHVQSIKECSQILETPFCLWIGSSLHVHSWTLSFRECLASEASNQIFGASKLLIGVGKRFISTVIPDFQLAALGREWNPCC